MWHFVPQRMFDTFQELYWGKSTSRFLNSIKKTGTCHIHTLQCLLNFKILTLIIRFTTSGSRNHPKTHLSRQTWHCSKSILIWNAIFVGTSFYVWALSSRTSTDYFFLSFLSTNLSRVCTSRDHLFFWSLDFHELWHGHNDRLSFTEVVAWPQWLCFTEVRRWWATLVLGWVTTSVHYSCFWWLCACAGGLKPLLALLSPDFLELCTTLVHYSCFWLLCRFCTC